MELDIRSASQVRYAKRAPTTNLRVGRGRSPKKECVHCGHFRDITGRGLCQPCHKNPEIRCMYARKNKYTEAFIEPKKIPLPARPTTAIPGSETKMQVMSERAKAKTQLFHPADARYPGDPRTLEYLASMA